MRIEPQLVEEVLDQVSTGRIEQSITGVGAIEGTARAGRIETPYLQLVLQRLWEVERGQGSDVMRLETFEALGGAERIVQDHLERAMRALSPGERAAAASVFGHLVTPSGTKIAHGTSDLATYAHLKEGEIRPVLDSLARQRILRPLGENGHAGGRYEIFHDVLAGAVLAWSTRHESNLALEEERKRRRRLGWVAAAALVGLALMAALAAYAFSQRSEARQQTAIAEEQRAIAVTKSADLAESNEKLLVAEKEASRTAEEALRLKRQADAEAAAAAAAEREAQAATLAAIDSQKEAEKQADRAEQGEAGERLAREQAQRDAIDADRAREQARRQAARANQQRRNALEARNAALVAQRRAQARYYIARASRLVQRDPEAAAESAELAMRFAQRKDDLRDTEDILRMALLAMRVQHVLPGAGPGGAGLAQFSANRRTAAEVARFSADGRRAAVGVGGNSATARVFRTSDGKLLRPFTAGGALNDLALSKDGHFLAAAGTDGRVWVWDVDAGTVREFDHGAPVTAVAWSPTTDILAAVGGTTAHLWDISTGAQRSLGPQNDIVNGAAFSRNGQLVATYGRGPLVSIFNVETGIRISTLTHPAEGQTPVTSVVFGPQGDVIVTGRGNHARLWDVTTGQPLLSFAGHTSTVTGVAISEDGQRVATGSLDSVARVFIASSGDLDALYSHAGPGINDIDFSPEKGNYAIVTAGGDGTARFSAEGQQSFPLLGHKRAVLGASFSPDGRSVLTSSSDGTARLFDPYGEPIPRVLVDYDSAVTTVAVDPSGSLIAVGRQDGAVLVLSPDSGDEPRTLVRPGGSPVVSVAWAGGRKLLAAKENGRVRIWADAGASPLPDVLHRSRIRAAAISSNGALAATAGRNGEARIWRLSDGTFRVLPHDAAVNAVAFDSSGRYVATASGLAAYTWRTSGGNPLRKFEPEGETKTVTGVAFGDGGRILATSSEDWRVRTWTVKTGQIRKTFVRHGSAVQGIAFSPDSRWFASVASRKAAIWQVGDSDLDGNFLVFAALPLQQQTPLTSVAFSRNHTVVMGSAAGQVLSYRCQLCGQLPQLATTANKKLAHLRAEARR